MSKKIRHAWDYPNSVFSATCTVCGCFRIKEKFKNRLRWVYYPKTENINSFLFSVPTCTAQREEKNIGKKHGK
jgi:hypothetical protein